MQLDQRILFSEQLRALERRHYREWAELQNWARWCLGRDDGRPQMKASAVWSMPGETPDWLEGSTEAPKIEVDEIAAKQSEACLRQNDFPACARKVIVVQFEAHPCYLNTPESDKPKKVKMTASGYIEYLNLGLSFF